MAKDPSPEQIRERCAEIQRGWSSDEKQRRLRVDLRPVVRTADDRLVMVTAAAYETHHNYQEASR